MDALKNKILNKQGVVEIQKMKLWTLDGRENAAMIHLLVDNVKPEESDSLRAEIRKILEAEEISVSALELDYRKN